MAPPLHSTEATELLRLLVEERSWLDRLRGHDHRPALLARLAELRNVRAIPDLLRLLASDDALAPEVARTLADLLRKIDPATLWWLDEQVRHTVGWKRLHPGEVRRLAETAGLDTSVVGLLASHANGFVRAAALEVMAERHDGEEIPFLSLRANDWVEPVATRAQALLESRLRPDNRDAVLDALPFILRARRQQRRDYREIERALRSVLLSDGGDDAIARRHELDTAVRRSLFAILIDDATASGERMVAIALSDPDDVIRSRAVAALPSLQQNGDAGAQLETVLSADPSPVVRGLALTGLAEHFPERLMRVFPHVLFDRATRVRGIARFVANAHKLPFVPRDLYVQRLQQPVSRGQTVVLDGLGETGTREDAGLVTSFLTSRSPRARYAALRALAKLDVERAIPAAVAAIGDDAPSVRRVALEIIDFNASRVSFALVWDTVRSLSSAPVRARALRSLLRAPKWDAVIFLLEAMDDPDEEVQSVAARLVDVWVESGYFNRNQSQPTATQLERVHTLVTANAPRLSGDTVELLRFSIKALTRPPRQN